MQQATSTDPVPPAGPDEKFDTIATLARRILDVPAAMFSVITEDEHRLPGADADGGWDAPRSYPLTVSICRYVVDDRAPLVLDDTRTEPRLADTPSVLEERVLAYAGIPVVDVDGETVGSFCVTDTQPRTWTPDELEVLHELAAICSSELQRRQSASRAAVAADRDRIARELASDVFGELLSLSMLLAGLRASTAGPAADASQQALDTVDRVLKTIRRTIFDATARPTPG